MVSWYCPNKFQCNILLSQFELSPLHRWLNTKKIESEVKYGDKAMTNSISHGKLKHEIHGCMDSKSW